MTPSPDSLPCACTALRKASRAVSRVYDEALADAGLTTPQFSILRTLTRGGSMPLSRLADVMVMDRTSLYRMLAPLTRQGWIEIGEAPAGKAKLAALSAEGRAAMAMATPRWQAAQSRIVGMMGAENWAALESALTNITSIAVDAAD